MRELSVLIITLDEAANIGACLESASFGDEAIVVDCGSKDETVAIAREHGATVLERDWPGVAIQKQRAVDAAGSDWVLCLDADERVTPALRASIERVLDGQGDDGPAGYALGWETWYLGGRVRSDRGRSRWKVRLYDRRRGRWTGAEPHAHVALDGAVERLDGALLHLTYRDIRHHVEKMNQWTTAAAEAMLDTRRSALFGMLIRPAAAFLKSWLLRGGFLDGGRGFVVARMSAYYVFLKYLKLADLRRAQRRASDGA